MSLSELSTHRFDWWGEGGKWDAVYGSFVFLHGGSAAEDGAEDLSLIHI